MAAFCQNLIFCRQQCDISIFKPKNSEGSAERIKRLRFRQPSGNPSGNGNFNDDIGTKEWDKWVCPNPEETISYPGFWRDLADDPDVCTDDDFCEDEDQEIEEETQIETILI